MTSSLPQRSCIACRRKGDQASFFRIARLRSGELGVVDFGPPYGRSGYLCRTDVCVRNGLAKDRLPRAIKISVSPEQREALLNELICKLKKKNT